jgi:hypothetical protein
MLCRRRTIAAIGQCCVARLRSRQGSACGGGKRHGGGAEKVNEPAEFREFMANRGFGITWADGAGFAKVMDDGNKAMGTAMKRNHETAGLAKG